MFMDEMEDIERQQDRLRSSREERSLLPVDSCSQLDTGYTGRPDTDGAAFKARMKAERDRQIAAIMLDREKKKRRKRSKRGG